MQTHTHTHLSTLQPSRVYMQQHEKRAAMPWLWRSVSQIYRVCFCLIFKRKSPSCILAWSHDLNVLHITATRGGSGGLFIFKSRSSHKRSKDLFPSPPTLTFAWHHGKRNQSVFCTSPPLLQPDPSRQRWFVHMLRQSYSFSLSHYRLLTLSEGFPLAETGGKKEDENKKEREDRRISPLSQWLMGPEWQPGIELSLSVTETSACLIPGALVSTVCCWGFPWLSRKSDRHRFQGIISFHRPSSLLLSCTRQQPIKGCLSLSDCSCKCGENWESLGVLLRFQNELNAFVVAGLGRWEKLERDEPLWATCLGCEWAGAQAGRLAGQRHALC